MPRKLNLVTKRGIIAAPRKLNLVANPGAGLGGAAVVYPFAGGFVSGILGEMAFGSLELPPFSDVPSTLFWGGFAWIYVMQV